MPLESCKIYFFRFFLVFIYLFSLFRAASKVYGSSQARGQIGPAGYAYAIAAAMRVLSHIWDLPHSSQQCQILNPLSGATDRTWILMDTSWVCYPWATIGTPISIYLFIYLFIRASPATYGSSQVRGQIGTASQQHQTHNPLSGARDHTHILMDTCRVLNLLSHNRNSKCNVLNEQTLFFRAILGSQPNWEESKESSQIPPTLPIYTQLPHQCQHPVLMRYICYNQGTNNDISLSTKVHSLH